MFRIYKGILILLAASVIIPACKKGDGDPSLSLRSRKARLAGQWNVTSYEEFSSTKGTGDDYEETLTHDGKSIYGSLSYLSYNSTFSEKGSVSSHILAFEEDGTYRLEFKRNISVTENGNTLASVSLSEKEYGTWQFLGKAGDIKDKEMIALTPMDGNYESIYYDGAGDIKITEAIKSEQSSFARTYTILGLANKKVTLETSDINTQTYTEPNSFGSFSIETTMKFGLEPASE